MNKFIQQQLNSVKVADIPEFDDTTTYMIIPKKEYISIYVGGCYLIELEDYLLHPSDTFTLHVNWNNNIIPVNKYMKCVCVKFAGSMVKVEGVGFDCQNEQELDTTWSGWLPLKSIKVLKEI